ncbi:hypothetical protein NP233_g11186 [Leucocoprinus birnbaumii]|uniref:Uncharacterized protein n=1 Tax=Leucocoprinus birnbaumii TaxID=56174 RepID=A0AAD5YLI0_9AGAR|nr:hypothetical protein NP233_g11186 [Leucocoprinus birnbaumii]
MPFILQFINHIYGKRDQYTVTLGGLGASGKTTLLYDVEAFKPPTTAKNGAIKTASHDICAWDVGTGCALPSHMVNLIRWYLDAAHALVWMVDSQDREMLRDSIESLAELLEAYEQKNESSDEQQPAKPQQIPILVNRDIAGAGEDGQSSILPSKEIRKTLPHQTSIGHFSIQSMSQDFVPNANVDDCRAWVDGFARFLIVSPYIVDGSLWMDYYSKEVIMTLAAKEQMVLPDEKHLPSIANRDMISKLRSEASS